MSTHFSNQFVGVMSWFVNKWTQFCSISHSSSCEELTHWKRPWCWEGLGAGGEGDDRRWDGWMASPTRWAWVWVNSGSWWWTGRPGMLQFMGSQRVRHDWVTELNWTECDTWWEPGLFQEEMEGLFETWIIKRQWSHKYLGEVYCRRKKQHLLRLQVGSNLGHSV